MCRPTLSSFVSFGLMLMLEMFDFVLVPRLFSNSTDRQHDRLNLELRVKENLIHRWNRVQELKLNVRGVI